MHWARSDYCICERDIKMLKYKLKSVVFIKAPEIVWHVLNDRGYLGAGNRKIILIVNLLILYWYNSKPVENWWTYALNLFFSKDYNNFVYWFGSMSPEHMDDDLWIKSSTHYCLIFWINVIGVVLM